MGMGEPLANYDNVLAARSHDQRVVGPGYWCSQDHAEHGRLAQTDSQTGPRGACNSTWRCRCTHAIQEQREELDPPGAACRWTICSTRARSISTKTGREITLEYILLDDVNMTQKHAARLAAIVRQLRCNVNLLRYNPVPGVPYFSAECRDGVPLSGGTAATRCQCLTSVPHAARTSTPPAGNCAAV